MTARGVASASSLVPDVFPPALPLVSEPSSVIRDSRQRLRLAKAIAAQFAPSPVAWHRLPNGNSAWRWETRVGPIAMHGIRPVVERSRFVDVVARSLDEHVRPSIDAFFRFTASDDDLFGPYVLKQLTAHDHQAALLRSADARVTQTSAVTNALLRLAVVESMHRSLLQAAIDDAGPAFADLPLHARRSMDAFAGLIHLVDAAGSAVDESLCRDARALTAEVEAHLAGILVVAQDIPEATLDALTMLKVRARRRIEAIDARSAALQLRFEGIEGGALAAFIAAFREHPGDEILVRRIERNMIAAAQERGEHELVLSDDERDLEIAEELLLFGETHFRGRAPRPDVVGRSEFGALAAAAFVPVSADAVRRFTRAMFEVFADLPRRAVLGRLATPEGQHLARGVIIAGEVGVVREREAQRESTAAADESRRYGSGEHPVLERDL